VFCLRPLLTPVRPLILVPNMLKILNGIFFISLKIAPKQQQYILLYNHKFSLNAGLEYVANDVQTPNN
jgi:hypothetical protein